MANKSRTEVKTSADAIMVATLDLADHKTLLKDHFAESAIYKKDDIGTQSATTTNTTVNFSSYDTIRLDAQSNDLNLTLSNIADGQIVALRITGKATNTVAFANATDITPNQDYITALDDVTYLIFAKDSTSATTMYALAMVNTITPSTDAQLRKSVIQLGDWDMDASAGISVTHGIADFTKIRSVSVLIVNDAGTIIYDLLATINGGTGLVAGGITNIQSSLVFINRTPTGLFDSTDFNSTAYNRGWMTIWHEI